MKKKQNKVKIDLMNNYYSNKTETLKQIFGTNDITLTEKTLAVKGTRYPVIDDVIIIVDEKEYTPYVVSRLGKNASSGKKYFSDIQYSFSEEWTEYSSIMPEHKDEFDRYFDIVDDSLIDNKRVCDLGCGIGRWSYFIRERVKELVLVDFSDAIFEARKNLADSEKALFFMGDITRLPFSDDFSDFMFSLGVLHHLPVPCLEEVKRLSRYSSGFLVFLYYALDNRPAHYRVILSAVTLSRKILVRIKNNRFRKMFSSTAAYTVYMPLILLGRLLAPFGLGSHIPLYDFYKDRSAERIKQDVYDRFFTSIEQRVTKKQIENMAQDFRRIKISEGLPYWHFLLER